MLRIVSLDDCCYRLFLSWILCDTSDLNIYNQHRGAPKRKLKDQINFPLIPAGISHDSLETGFPDRSSWTRAIYFACYTYKEMRKTEEEL